MLAALRDRRHGRRRRSCCCTASTTCCGSSPSLIAGGARVGLIALLALARGWRRRRSRSTLRAAAGRADRLRRHDLARAGRGHVPGGRADIRRRARGGYGIGPRTLVESTRRCSRYVRSHHPGTRWALLTVASDAGRAVHPARARTRARSAATAAPTRRSTAPGSRGWSPTARRATSCSAAPTRCAAATARPAPCCSVQAAHADAVAQPRRPYTGGLVLFDCAGREHALATLRRAAAQQALAQAATESSRWKARANSSRSRPRRPARHRRLAVGDQPQLDRRRP